MRVLQNPGYVVLVKMLYEVDGRLNTIVANVDFHLVCLANVC
jgi:hypothetical protein